MMEEDMNFRLFKLYDIYEDYTVSEIVNGELVISFKENTPQHVKDAYYEAKEIMNSPDYMPSR